MRRTLVLTDETAGHPFLASLPPHIRQAERAVPAPSRWPITSGDVRDFLLAYCACFLAVSAYIA